MAAARLFCALMVAVLLVTATPHAAAATAAPPTDLSRRGTASAPAVTTTALSVTPNSGDSATVFSVRANVSPIPGGGEVRFTLWTAASGGELLWDHTFAVNSQGVARIPGGINLDPGTQWWQAQFLGTSSFAASTSTRKQVTVSGIASTISNVSITWREGWGETIQFGARGGPLDARGGAMELVVDGQVYASCGVLSNSNTASCSATNRLRRGVHAVYVRYVPDNVRYGSASSAVAHYPVGDPLPPSSGFLVEAGDFSTASTSVEIDVAAAHDGLAVTAVRLSNDDALEGSLLANGTTVPYEPVVAWQLQPGADGMRSVWAQLYTESGWSEPISDAIYLDTTAPTGSFVINDDDETIGDPWSGSFETQSLTGIVSDASMSQGGSISHVAVSNDGKKFRMIPYDWSTGEFDVAWDFHALWGAPSHLEAGLKTVYAKWRDQAGNWSPVVTDTIRYVDDTDVGYLEVDGERYVSNYDPLYRSSPEVTAVVGIFVAPAEGIDGIWIGDEVEDRTGAKWIDWPGSATELTFQLSLIDPAYGYTRADGFKSIGVYVVSNTGRRRAIAGIPVILDRVVPVADAPIPAFAIGTHVAENDLSAVSRGVTPTSAMSVLTEVAWRHNTSVSQYNLNRLDGSSWTVVPLNAPKSNSTRTELNAGITRQFRVRTQLKSGSITAWKTGPAFSVVSRQENDAAITYSGVWSYETRTDAFGDRLRHTTRKGAFARMTFTGRGIAWVAPRSLNGDTVAVYVDGVFIKLVHLTAGYYQPSRVVFSMAWKARGTHTIKIVKRYANGRKVPIDALLVLN